MPKKVKNPFSHLWSAERGPYGLLVLLFLGVFVVPPLEFEGLVNPLAVDVVFSLVLIAGVFTVHSRKSVRLLFLAAAVVSVLARWVWVGFPGTLTAVIDAVLSVVMLALFSAMVLKQFVSRGRDLSHRIGGAIAVYLLLGMLWWRLYEMTSLVIPGAFRIPGGESALSSLLYFSFVTLTTLGYGYILPIHPAARSLAVLEAIMGQLYLAILIASLVSAKSSTR